MGDGVGADEAERRDVHDGVHGQVDLSARVGQLGTGAGHAGHSVTIDPEVESACEDDGGEEGVHAVPDLRGVHRFVAEEVGRVLQPPVVDLHELAENCAEKNLRCMK